MTNKPGRPFLKDKGQKITQVSCYATLENVLLLTKEGAKKIAEQAIRDAAAKIQ